MANNNNNNNKKKSRPTAFRIMVLDHHSLNQIKSYKISRTGIYLGITGAVLLIAVIMSLLFIYTPLNYLFPYRSNVKLQKQIIENSMVIDTLKSRLYQHQNYVAQLKTIMQGKVPIDTLRKETPGEKGKTAEKEVQFSNSYLDSVIRKQIEASEIESLTQTEPGINKSDNIKNLHFIVPLRGSITRGFNSSEGHFAVDIAPGTDNAVLATLSGTIILTEWSLETGHVIGIQHDNNLISFYKHNASLLKETGDRVSAGESIAISGNSGENTTGPHLHFELWKNGIPVNPEDYITF